MKERIVDPELLDHLPASDPRALRSRRDLRRLDLFLGNSRWIAHTIRQWSGTELHHIVELGAGEGFLCHRLARMLPESKIIGLDLAPGPLSREKNVEWICGDFFQILPRISADVVVGSLVLHHIPDECLFKLGQILKNFRLLIFVEPYRSSLVLNVANVALPLFGEVTQHDMPVSIRAGFRLGELSRLMNLNHPQWNIWESCHWKGSLRFVAHRR